jgi:diacylglycerol kinase family enzyme
MRGRCRDLDVLELHCNDVHGNAIQRFCFNVADVGLGGMVTQIADQQPRWLPSDLKYFLSVIMGLRRYKNSRLTYQSEVDSWSGRAMSICMANCVFFGSGMGIAPDAQPDDGVAEITIIGDVGVLDYLRQTPSLRKARRLNHPQIEYRRARWCSIDAENPCPIELDGEFIGQTPLTMHVVPRAIRFLV